MSGDPEPVRQPKVAAPRFGLLRSRDFRSLFGAHAVSQFGTQISVLALPLVAVLSLDASNFAVGLLSVCGTAAFVLVGLPAGAWVDRTRRRNVMIVTDVARFVLVCSVPVAWWLDVLTIGQMFLVSLVVGVLTVSFDVAYQSLLPHIVGREHLVEGNAKLEAVRAVNSVGGPSVAGILVQVLTAPVALLVDALSFLASAMFVLSIRKPEVVADRLPGASLGREVAEGLRFVLHHPVLRAIAIATSISNLSGGILGAMVVVFLARDLGASSSVIGVVYSVSAVGGLLGAVIATRVAVRVGYGPAIWGSVIVIALFGFTLPLAQPGWLLWVTAAGFAVAVAANAVYNIAQVSFRQAITPERLLGRMNATVRFVTWGALPLGGLLGALLGEYSSPRSALWVAAMVGVVAILPLLLSPLRRMRDIPEPDTDPVIAMSDLDP